MPNVISKGIRTAPGSSIPAVICKALRLNRRQNDYLLCSFTKKSKQTYSQNSLTGLVNCARCSVRFFKQTSVWFADKCATVHCAAWVIFRTWLNVRQESKFHQWPHVDQGKTDELIIELYA